MNHSDDHDKNHDLFARLEAEMAADESGGAVLDLNKARSARGNPTDTPDASTDAQEERRHEESGNVALKVDPPTATGPGLMERVRGARRNTVLPAWLRSKPELLDGAGWLIGSHGTGPAGARTSTSRTA